MRNDRTNRLVAAVAVGVALNTALTLQNAWPTLWPKPGAGISVELLALIALVAVYMGRRPTAGRLFAWSVTAALFALIVGRYVAVTSHSLFGRPINIHFDLPHLPQVVAMTAGSSSAFEILAVTAIALSLLLAGLLLVRWAVGALAQAMSNRGVRRATGGLAAAGIVLFLAASVPALHSLGRAFAEPVSPVYARQAGFLVDALIGRSEVAYRSEPAVTPDFARLNGGDVIVIFLESYGEVAYRLPDVAEAVRARALDAERRLRKAGWHIASGFFRSPTFGGASWLAHASFLAGTTVSENRDYQLLLSSDRATLVRAFAEAGYRTVAVMPGLKLAWPEGKFYGFDAIYDASSLNYGGPAFGWWTIPDQFTLGRLDEQELRAPGRKPLFIVYPTIMSHLPFSPVPPHLADWSKSLDPAAYGPAPARPSLLGDWTAARQAYRAAMIYNIDLIDGFLAERAPADAFVVVLGDHQPPGLISGTGASWLVPVHVLARDEKRIAAFLEAGLKEGMIPSGGELGDFAALHRKFALALK